VAAGECPAVGFSAEKKRLPVAVAPGLPEWALAPFQILLFRIRGVDLAVRLKELDSILRWNGESTAIPGQPGWQRGLFLHQRGVVSLVDLSGLIMPERSMPDADALPAYLLLVGGARRGVLCDSIQRPRLVCADDVRWHLSREKRPWSYGIMAENLAMLLDVNALMRMLGTNCA
jgi:purine-binding chemotaxis protein CheW